MRPDNALALLDRLAEVHQHGHMCWYVLPPEVPHPQSNGVVWFNQHAGRRREKCPTLVAIETIRADVTTLHAQVHDAAHNDQTALRVGMAAIGYTAEELAQVDDAAEAAAGVLQMGRDAIETLAAELDRDPDREARATAAAERLGASDA